MSVSPESILKERRGVNRRSIKYESAKEESDRAIRSGVLAFS
jgi:hypothetical protein